MPGRHQGPLCGRMLVDAPSPRSLSCQAERLTETDRDEGWLSVHLGTNRAEEVNQKAGRGGHLRLRPGVGTDLEMLFLELTGGQGPSSSEGEFVGLGARPTAHRTAAPRRRRGTAA